MIGEHVWVGKGTRILAGARIGDGSVIGAYSVLAGKIPNNCVAAGNPCTVVKRDIFWSKHRRRPLENYTSLPERFQGVDSRYIQPTEME